MVRLLVPRRCVLNRTPTDQVCQSKFLQHCSTDPVLREAASAAGKKFAASKEQQSGKT